MYASGREYWENYKEWVTFGSITDHQMTKTEVEEQPKLFLIRWHQIFFSRGGVGYMD
jgi:hypothetical protein